MASKRSSRAYINEPDSRQEPLPTSSQISSQTSYRSRRSSRSSITDDMPSHQPRDAQEARFGVSIKEAAAIAGAQNSLPPKEVVSNNSRSSDSVSVMSSSSSTTTSASQSERSVSLNGRPNNFGVVVPGVYRSSYPRPDNYEYIKSLGLKTIITLVKTDELDHDLGAFVAQNGIRQVVFNMKGTKKEAIPIRTMRSILRIIFDQQNHPLLIHCNHGKHRTGCVVGVVRKVSGWSTEAVVDEYRRYAELKARDCDVEYLRAFQVSSLRESVMERIQSRGRNDRLFFRLIIFTATVIMLWMITGSFMASSPTNSHDRLLK